MVRSRYIQLELSHLADELINHNISISLFPKANKGKKCLISPPLIFIFYR